jgi:hypothetical protein
MPEHANWLKIRNRDYSQWVGREELFERERGSNPDVRLWEGCVMACAEANRQGTENASTAEPKSRKAPIGVLELPNRLADQPHPSSQKQRWKREFRLELGELLFRCRFACF